MRNITFVLAIAIALFSCGNKHMVKTPKRQKTPSHLVMSQDEKVDVNYDQRETRRVVDQNLKNKEKNQKAAEKNRQKQVAAMNEANNNTSKVKKKKSNSNEAFSFY